MTPTTTQDPPPPDEIALPAFEDALWTALRAEHAELTIASTSTTDDVEVLSPGAAAPVAPPRRRPGRRLLAAAAAVAVLAGIGVVASSHGRDGATIATGPSTESTGPSTESTGPSAESTGPSAESTLPPDIEEEVRAVLDPIAGSTVSVETTYEDGVLVSRRWTDSLSWASRTVWYDADGEPTGELGVVDPPVADEVVEDLVWVDHCLRRWGVRQANARTSPQVVVVAKDVGRAIFADGREVLDGEELIRLHPLTDEAARELLDPVVGLKVGRQEIRPDQLDRSTTYLLDPDTLLPVAVRSSPETLVRITIEPRTAETLQQLVTTGPTGFEEVQPPVEDGTANWFIGARAC